MKKLYHFSFLIAFIVLFSVNSCKKEAKNSTPLPGKIADTHVKPEEINAWFDQMPSFKPAATLLAAAQEAIINGVQVVRIPVGYNAALYFTKRNDSLKVYTYKWRYQNLDAEKYTGNIDAYNFQTQTMVDFTYLNGVITNSAVLAHFGQQAANVSANGQLRVSEVCPILTFLAKLWEWITEAVTDTSSGDGSAGGGGDFASFMSSFGYSVSDYSNYVSPTGGGGNGIYADMGGKIGWGPPPCPPSAGQYDDAVKLKVNKVNPDDPNNPPPTPGCVVVSQGQWAQYVVNTNNIVSKLTYNLSITDSNEQAFLNNNPNVVLELYNFLEQNGYTQENKDLINWAINYLMANPTVTIEEFKNEFLIPSEGLDGDYHDTFWSDPSLVVPRQNLPTYQAFYNAYPKGMSAAQVYQLVGGSINSNHLSGNPSYQNACAIRVSRALNYCGGINIPVYIDPVTGNQVTEKGEDGKNYFLGAKDLNKWLNLTFGQPNYHLTKADGGVNGGNFPNKLTNAKGIYSMVSDKPSWASGHADIIDKTTFSSFYRACDSGCHFNGPVEFIDVWLLQQ